MQQIWGMIIIALLVGHCAEHKVDQRQTSSTGSDEATGEDSFLDSVGDIQQDKTPEIQLVASPSISFNTFRLKCDDASGNSKVFDFEFGVPLSKEKTLAILGNYVKNCKLALINSLKISSQSDPVLLITPAPTDLVQTKYFLINSLKHYLLHEEESFNSLPDQNDFLKSANLKVTLAARLARTPEVALPVTPINSSTNTSSGNVSFREAPSVTDVTLSSQMTGSNLYTLNFNFDCGNCSVQTTPEVATTENTVVEMYIFKTADEARAALLSKSIVPDNATGLIARFSPITFKPNIPLPTQTKGKLIENVRFASKNASLVMRFGSDSGNVDLAIFNFTLP